MAYFFPLKPLGARACGRSGELLPNAWQFRDIAEFVAEVESLENNNFDPQLSEVEHTDMKRALLDLMRDARDGALDAASGSSARMKPIVRHDCMIELRPRLHGSSAFGSRAPKRELRLYFAEPKRSPAQLLPLLIGTKPRGEDVDNEQNVSIDVAYERVEAWAYQLCVSSSY